MSSYEGNVLKDFVNNIYICNSMNPIESGESIIANSIHVVSSIGYSSGLLMTQNGFFVTAYHCLDKKDSFGLISVGNKVYSFNKTCIVSRAEDVAICKAEMPFSASPIRYNIFPNENVERLTSVVMSSKRDDVSDLVSGFVIGKDEIIDVVDVVNKKNKKQLLRRAYNQTQYYLKAVPGCSGSPIFEIQNGSLMGIMCSTSENKEEVSSHGASSRKILDLASILAYELDKKDNLKTIFVD